MKIDFTIKDDLGLQQTIKGKLNAKTLVEVERCLDVATKSLKKNRVGSITICCTLEVEQEEK